MGAAILDLTSWGPPSSTGSDVKCAIVAPILLVVVWGVSADTLIIHTFLSAPACTDMVSSKGLERDVTTKAMAKEPPRLKTLASFVHST